MLSEDSAKRTLLDTDVTIDRIEEILREHFNTSSKIVDWECEEIGQGQGFLSHMGRTKLTWSPPEQRLPNSVMAKIPSPKGIEQLAKAAEMELFEHFVEKIKTSVARIHNCEVAAYRMFKNLSKSPMKLLVEIYAADEMGGDRAALILMDDLSEVAGCQDMIHGLQLPQLLTIAGELGRLHAWSLTHEDWRQKEMSGLTSVFGTTDTFDQFQKQMEVFFEEIKSADWLEILGQELIQRVPKLSLEEDAIKNWDKEHRKLEIPDVMVHGDLWNNNILIQKDAEGNPNGRVLAIIDWQGVHPGSPTEDFCRLFAMSVSEEIRRRHWQEIMQHYYRKLEGALGRRPPFTYEKLTVCFHRQMRFQVGLLLPMIPGMVRMMEAGSIVNILDPVAGKNEFMKSMKALIEDVLELMEQQQGE